MSTFDLRSLELYWRPQFFFILLGNIGRNFIIHGTLFHTNMQNFLKREFDPEFFIRTKITDAKLRYHIKIDANIKNWK